MTETPPFLGIPAETRVQIYGYLLSTKHTKYHPKVEDPDWNHYPHTSRSSHAYRFHVGILGANRLINAEASKVLYEQNMFIELTLELTPEDKWLGVPIIAHSVTKLRFPHCVLQIALKCKPTLLNKSESATKLVFAGADLPAFCTALTFGGIALDWISESSFMINVNCSTAGKNVDNPPSISTPLVKRFLEPLHSLHSFQFAHLTGPLDKQYKADLCSSICKKAPSFRESFLGVMDIVQKGDEAFDVQDPTVHYARAIKAYGTALTYLTERCISFDYAITFGSLPYSDEDFNVHTEFKDLLCKLYTNLATAHFGLGQYVQSRKWSQYTLEEACLSNPHYEVASLLFVRSNHKLGRWDEAVGMMEMLVEKAKEAPRLVQELETMKEGERRHKEVLLETVKTVLAKSRVGNGQPLAIRYPADFQKVREMLSSQRLRDD